MEKRGGKLVKISKRIRGHSIYTSIVKRYCEALAHNKKEERANKVLWITWHKGYFWRAIAIYKAYALYIGVMHNAARTE
jgi:hypothetical protein